jgi:hypothetical protein
MYKFIQFQLEREGTMNVYASDLCKNIRFAM